MGDGCPERFAAKLRPTRDMTWMFVAEYLFGLTSPSPDDAFRRVVVDFFGIHWAQWMLAGASVASAVAFAADRTICPRIRDITAPVDPQVVLGLVASVVRTANTERTRGHCAAAEPLVLLAIKSRYGIAHNESSPSLPSRITNIARWCGRHCKDPATKGVICRVEDSMRDLSLTARVLSAHS